MSEAPSYLSTKIDLLADILEHIFGKLTLLMNDSSKDNQIAALQGQVQALQAQFMQAQTDALELKNGLQLKQTNFKLKKRALKDQIVMLNEQLAESRQSAQAQREDLQTVAKEQSKLQRKMEMWFSRRLEKLEVKLLELHSGQLDEVVRKIRKFKKSMPWKQPLGNHQKPRQLVLPGLEPECSRILGSVSRCGGASSSLPWKNSSRRLESRRQLAKLNSSDGTSTPFSNYSNFSSDHGLSLNRTVNQAFLISQDNSQLSFNNRSSNDQRAPPNNSTFE